MRSLACGYDMSPDDHISFIHQHFDYAIGLRHGQAHWQRVKLPLRYFIPVPGLLFEATGDHRYGEYA